MVASGLSPTAQTALSTLPADVQSEAWFDDRVLVSVDPDDVAAVAQQHGIEVLRIVDELGLARLSVPAGRSVSDVL
ncbi:MAG: hypothetical protein AAF211_18205, partial [Myxococcota bacterium]